MSKKLRKIALVQLEGRGIIETIIPDVQDSGVFKDKDVYVLYDKKYHRGRVLGTLKIDDEIIDRYDFGEIVYTGMNDINYDDDNLYDRTVYLSLNKDNIQENLNPKKCIAGKHIYDLLVRPITLNGKDKRYLCIYNDKEDAEDRYSEPFEVKYSEARDFVIKHPEFVDGIIEDMYTDFYLKDSEILLKGKIDDIMGSDDKMRYLLENLKEDEKEFLGELSYKAIYKTYHEKTSPKKIAEDLNKSLVEIDYALSHGYHCIKELILANY